MRKFASLVPVMRCFTNLVTQPADGRHDTTAHEAKGEMEIFCRRTKRFNRCGDARGVCNIFISQKDRAGCVLHNPSFNLISHLQILTIIFYLKQKYSSFFSFIARRRVSHPFVGMAAVSPWAEQRLCHHPPPPVQPAGAADTASGAAECSQCGHHCSHSSHCSARTEGHSGRYSAAGPQGGSARRRGGGTRKTQIQVHIIIIAGLLLYCDSH